MTGITQLVPHDSAGLPGLLVWWDVEGMSEGRPTRQNETLQSRYAHLRLEAGVYPWPLDRALGGVALLRVRETTITATRATTTGAV